jgi:4,5-dihydroxyphthalate decarboxylase
VHDPPEYKAMSRLPLTLTCWTYDRVTALKTGRATIEGVDLNMMQLPVEEMFYRVFHHHEFDIVEMSLSSYMMARAAGEWVYEAIPVFLSRMFRHSAIFIRADRGIERPEDLKGRRVGVPEYAQTAAMTARGVLQDDYQVSPRDLHWVTGGLEQPGRHEKLPLNIPGVDIRHSTDKSLSAMLVDGEIDALISARNPSCFGRDPNIIRLFRDHVAAEKNWYRRTGIHPIMHTVGIRTTLVHAHPWLPASVMKAFAQARAICISEIDGTGGAAMATLPWMTDYVEETRSLMGDDFWPYGYARNEVTLKAAARWSCEQGLTPRLLDPSTLFCRSTLGEFRV